MSTSQSNLIFVSNDNESVYNTILTMVDNDKENVCLKEQKSTTSIYMFDALAFTIIINSRTQCIKTNVKAALDYTDTIGCATVKGQALSIPLSCGNEYYDAVKDMVNAVYQSRRNSLSGDNIGCCDMFVMCSDALKCLRSDDPYFQSCIYRKNLEAGRIFYGKNKNT